MEKYTLDEVKTDLENIYSEFEVVIIKISESESNLDYKILNLENIMETINKKIGFINLNKKHRVQINNIQMYYPDGDNNIIFLLKDKQKITIKHGSMVERDDMMSELDNRFI